MDDSAKITLTNSFADETPGPTPADEGQTTQTAAAPTPQFDRVHPETFVGQYLRHHRLEILFDGSIAEIDAQSRAPLTVRELLAKEEETVPDLIDGMVIFAKVKNYPFRKSIISTACRQVVKGAKGVRRQTVMAPLIEPELTDAEMAKSRDEWARVGTLFDLEPSLSVAIIKHFVWQVKAKLLGKDVKHHLMPIVWSSIQGSGKTTFVKGLVGPLRELACFTYLSDIADTRSKGIFSFPAVVVDDMAPEKGVAVLKSRITGDRMSGRDMRSSSTSPYRISSTFIGTANTTIQDLVRDATGSRRFAMLPFRNGSVEKGGSPLIWPIVESLDYRLLWRSVSAQERSPIFEVLDELARYQGQFVQESSVLRWLKRLDFTSEEVRDLSHLRAGVMAEPLRDLFMKQTRESISRQAFSAEILKNCDDPDVPFAKRDKIETGALYVLKPGFADRARPHPAAPSSRSASLPAQGSQGSPASPASPASPVHQAAKLAAHPVPLDADTVVGGEDQ